MKPVLVLGLGNPLMSDDGVGVRVARMLAGDPRVTRRADVLAGGTDLLRYMDEFLGRRRVILVDAAESAGPPGEVQVVEDLPGSGESQSAHALSAAASLRLLRRVMPDLRETAFTWVLVGIRGTDVHPELSPEIASTLPQVAAVVSSWVRMPVSRV